MDGRRMECAPDGGTWGSRIMFDGDSRPMRAGAGAPGEASWGALLVLDTAWRRAGVPEALKHAHWAPPIPLAGRGAATGRLSSAAARGGKLAHTLLPRPPPP